MNDDTLAYDVIVEVGPQNEFLTHEHTYEHFREEFYIPTLSNRKSVESFFANLKKEAVHWVHFRTCEEACSAMFAYIEGYYNTKRIQKRLGYLSPMHWLQQWNRNNLGAAA